MSFLLWQWARALPRAPHAPSPRERGEGHASGVLPARHEGRRRAPAFAYAAAPHPSPLPVLTGRGDLAAFRDGWCFSRHSVEELI